MRHTRGVDVRDLLPEESDAAVALWRQCDLTRPWNDPVADLARALTNPTSTVLVAQDGDDLVGTAMVGYDGHRGWVYYVAVSPHRRREGIGRLLMERCERWLGDRGVPKVQLMVRQGNTAAAFYRSLGYADQQTVALGRFLDPELEQLRRAGSGG